MKRVLSLFLTLAMLASFGTALGETANSQPIAVAESFNEAMCIAYTGGKLYALDYNGRMYIGDEETFGTWEIYTLPEEYTTYSRGLEHNLQTLFADDEAVYALVDVRVSDDYSTTIEGLYVYELSFNEDGTVDFDNELSLDTYEMIEAYDDYEYIRTIQSAFVQDGMLVVSTYGRGNGMDIIVFDMNDGSYVKPFTEYVEEVSGYKDDMLLVTLRDYSKSETVVKLATVDIYTDEVIELTVIPTKSYSTPSGLLYYDKNDSVYYVNDGELFRMSLSDVNNPVAVAGMRVSRISRRPAITEKGFYLACDYSDMTLVNIDPSARPTRQLKLMRSYDPVFESAVRKFIAAHPEVEVLLKDYQSDLVQSMMSRSNDIDIYSLSISGDDYYPLLERGYMAELSDSKILKDFVNAMYPNLAKIAKHNGEPVALPFRMDNDTMGYNNVVFEKLGFTTEDVPTTWFEYFDFIAEAARRCEDRDDVHVFEPYYTMNDMRTELFYAMFRNYMLYMLTDANAEKAFDTPLLRSLIDKFEAFDFTVFGLPATYEEMEFASYDYTPNSVLITNYVNVSPYNQRSIYSATPMLLALSEGMEPMIGAHMESMFINPFSANRDLAIEFLELMAENLEDGYRAQVCPDVNEPVLNQYYDEQLKGIADMLEVYKNMAEAAADDEKEYYKTMLEEQQEYYEDFRDNMMWSISEESVAEYRKYAKYFVPQKYLNVEAEDGSYYEYVYQYTEGAIDKDTMLSKIDKTVRMILLEMS